MRFSIRDVLWLTALVALTLALGIGWLKDRSRLQHEKHELRVFMLSELERVERQAGDSWKEVVNQQIAEKLALERRIKELEALNRRIQGPKDQ